MGIAPLALQQKYWEKFEILDDDLEFLYNHLLEVETPLTPEELLQVLVVERIEKEKKSLEKQLGKAGDVYLPKESYVPGQAVQFPAMDWQRGKVQSVRDGNNPEIGPFKVMEVEFASGEMHSFATELAEHKLNTPISVDLDDPELNPEYVMKTHGKQLERILTDHIESNPDLVKIAGRWFPKALLVDINIGHLNLTEAILEVAGGGPLPTLELMEQLDLPQDVNTKLTEFSLNRAMQEDPRFDEVGPAGKVLWYLRRLEPESVQQPPRQLKHSEYQFDPSNVGGLLSQFEGQVADEMDDCIIPDTSGDEVSISLLYPHFRVGALPICGDLYRFFPTAYESPRVQFTFVDADTKEQLSGWVVREYGYVFGLRDWYLQNELHPGSLITIKKSATPGEVIIRSNRRRPAREWLRTAMVGSDGGIVFAMLKHSISSSYNERMAIVVSDQDALDEVWERAGKNRVSLPVAVKNVMLELAKLSPQGHVHAQELYAAVNVVRRASPGAILSILLEQSWAVHLGDLYFRIEEANESKG